MKILIAHPRVPIYGGAEQVIVQLANYLVRHGHVAGVLMPYIFDEMAVALDPAVALHETSLARLPVIVRKYDVVQPHNFPASAFAALSPRPVVWYCHEPPEMFTNWWRRPLEAMHRRLARGFDRIVAADKFNCRRLWDWYALGNKVPTIVPYGIDYEFFANGLRPKVAHDHFYIVQFGVISPYKNQMATLRAAAALLDRIPSLQVVLSGYRADYAYGHQVEDFVRSSGLGGRVHFTGFQHRGDVRRWMQLADVVVQPCGPQGGWLSPLEAICIGAPVVASPRVSCADMLREKGLADVTDDYAAGIVRVYDDPEAARLRTLRAREWVRENLTWERFGERMLDVMKEVVR